MFSEDHSLAHFVFRMLKKCLSYQFEINIADLLNTEPEVIERKRETEVAQPNPARMNSNDDSSVKPLAKKSRWM